MQLSTVWQDPEFDPDAAKEWIESTRGIDAEERARRRVTRRLLLKKIKSLLEKLNKMVPYTTSSDLCRKSWPRANSAKKVSTKSITLANNKQ